MRLRDRAVVFLGGLSFLCGVTLVAQAQQVTLPTGWPQMSADDLATAIRPLMDNDQFKLLTQSDQDAVEAQGKKLFLQVDLSKTNLSYQTLEMLHWLSRGHLALSDESKAKTALLGRQDNWAQQPYSEIRAKALLMMRLHIDDSSIIAEGRRWAAAGGTLDQVFPADLSNPLVSQVFADLQVINSGFSVQWDGLITAPQDGLYQFLISPININSGYSQHPVKFAMTVSVNGQVILSSSPDPNAAWSEPTTWVSESGGVALTAGQPVALSATVTVQPSQQLPSAMLHAMLFWKLPGTNTPVIVPQSALTVAGTTTNGLKATYSWTSNGQPQTLTRTEPNIDVAWTGVPILVSQNRLIAQQRNDTLWQALSAASYITDTLNTPGKAHPFLIDSDDYSAALTTDRRSAFLDLVLQNQELLDPLDTKWIARFYQSFRVGVPDKALDVFGAWAARHADLTCDIMVDPAFNGDQRLAFATLAILTTQQLPSQAATLQNRYLQLSDGRCSLPVAYTLACSYLGQKKFAEWTAFLDAKLADTSLAGDLRVNWLIARANAASLHPGSAVHYPYYFPLPYLDPLYGRSYLDEALAAAQSPAVKVRVAHEIVGQLTFRQDFAGAKAVLQSLKSLPADQQALVAGLLADQDFFLTTAQQEQANQPAQAQQAYVAELQRRRAQAAQNGNDAAVKRYDSLISAAGSGQ